MSDSADSTSTALPRLAPRPVESHKGDFGHALLVGGSRGMAGAMGLAGRAALRSGAGRVTVAVPDGCQATVASYDCSYMTVPLPEDGDGRIGSAARQPIELVATKATAVGLGPGLGRSSDLDSLVVWAYRTVPGPMVVDADGLNALAPDRGQLGPSAGPRILTPHPGEFARMVGHPVETVRERSDRAVELAGAMDVVIVLKGHETLVTDGHVRWCNTTGNPGMATGGSGDVLTGVITALLGQGLAPFDAARLGVHVHGLAGDLAADALGQIGMTAGDLVRFLPKAFRGVESR